MSKMSGYSLNVQDISRYNSEKKSTSLFISAGGRRSSYFCRCLERWFQGPIRDLLETSQSASSDVFEPIWTYRATESGARRVAPRRAHLLSMFFSVTR